MNRLFKCSLSVALAVSVMTSSALADGPHLNEIYASHTGTDDMEMIELIGTPGSSLTGYMVLVVEGDSSNPGTLDLAFDITGLSFGAGDPYFVLGNSGVVGLDLDIGASNIVENGTETFYLVKTANPAGITALVGTDIDGDADLVTDIVQLGLGEIVDCVAMIDGGFGSGDFVYDGPDGTFLPAGIYRNGDFPGSWCSRVFLDFDDVTNLSEPRTVGATNSTCSGGESTAFCTSGTSASGCQAKVWTVGIPSSTATSGFHLYAGCVEGGMDGIFYYGANGQQANQWGNGTSFRCVVPPTRRGGLMTGQGAATTCDGAFKLDLNARWCATCPKPNQNPGAGATMQAQLWYRDPNNTSNQTTSFSNAVEFTVR
jgi:hypothetical protein